MCFTAEDFKTSLLHFIKPGSLLTPEAWQHKLWARQFAPFLWRFWHGCLNSGPPSEAAEGGGVRGYQGRSRGVRRSREWALTSGLSGVLSTPLAQFYSLEERADVPLAWTQSLPWCSHHAGMESHQPVTGHRHETRTTDLEISLSIPENSNWNSNPVEQGGRRVASRSNSPSAQQPIHCYHTFPRSTPISSARYLDPSQQKF